GRALVAPLHRAESSAAEQRVEQPDGSERLIPVAEIRVAGLAIRHDILHGQRMPAPDAHGGRCLATQYVLEAAALGRGDAADVVFAPDQSQLGALAEDRLESDQRLRGESIVIVAFALTMNSPG